jgi:hypothetical protein
LISLTSLPPSHLVSLDLGVLVLDLLAVRREPRRAAVGAGQHHHRIGLRDDQMIGRVDDVAHRVAHAGDVVRFCRALTRRLAPCPAPPEPTAAVAPATAAAAAPPLPLPLHCRAPDRCRRPASARRDASLRSALRVQPPDIDGPGAGGGGG